VAKKFKTRFRLHGPGTDLLGRAGLADGTGLSPPDSRRSVRTKNKRKPRTWAIDYKLMTGPEVDTSKEVEQSG